MSNWKVYQRKPAKQYLRKYVVGEDLTGVSVSTPDMLAIKQALANEEDPGGYIAKDDEDATDLWYVREEWFDKMIDHAVEPEIV